MANWADTVEKATQDVASYILVTLAAGFFWVIRRVFTNQKQLELLDREIKARDETRQRDREDMQELKGDVKALRQDVMTLFQNHGG